MFGFLQLIADGSIKEKKKRKGRKRREYKRTPHQNKKTRVKNFWIRTVKGKWVSQIDQFLTTLYIKRMQFEVHKRVPP